MICVDGCCADFIYAMDDLLAVEDPYAAKVASKHGVENDEIVSNQLLTAFLSSHVGCILRLFFYLT